MMQAVNGESGAKAEEENKWQEYKARMESMFDAATDAADSAVYSWIEWDIPVVSPVMGGLATLATEDNILTTALTLGTAGTSSLGFISVKANAYVANLLLKYPSMLRWLPQAGVRGTLQEAGWVAGRMRQTTAARGGWPMVPNGQVAPRLQWSAAGGRHGGSYWKLSGPELGTQRIPYFLSNNVF